jgi:hypothetical protein
LKLNTCVMPERIFQVFDLKCWSYQIAITWRRLILMLQIYCHVDIKVTILQNLICLFWEVLVN